MVAEGCSYVFSEVVYFSLGLSGMSLKEEQLSAIKAVYEGRAKSGLMWEEPLVPNSAVCYGIRLGGDRAVSLCLPWSLY